MLQLLIPESDWLPSYDPAEDEPPGWKHARLHTTLIINGVEMHLDAYEVVQNSDPQRTIVCPDEIDNLAGLVGADGPFTTCEIGASWDRPRQYILIATPFS